LLPRLLQLQALNGFREAQPSLRLQFFLGGIFPALADKKPFGLTDHEPRQHLKL